MPESFRSFSKRIKKGLPLVSDEEKEFEKEAQEIQAVLDRRNKRRENLLWKSIPLLARNWHLFRKYPKLYNIPIDFVYFGDFFTSMPWEPQYHNVPLGGLVAAWKMEACQLTCPECQGKAYLVPQHMPESFRSCGCLDFLDGHSDSEEDIFWNTINYSNPYHVFCEKCAKIIDCYDYDFEISEKRSKFESIMYQWNKHVNPTVPGMQFVHALHLLTLYEASGEESDEFRHEVPKRKKSIDNEEFDFFDIF